MFLITESIREAGKEALINDGWDSDSAGECSVDDVFCVMLEKAIEDDQLTCLKIIGFNNKDIKNVTRIMESEDINLRCLLSQALNKYLGLDNFEFPPSSITD